MSRSRGPSKLSSLTGYASRMDSNSGSILQLHCFTHACHRLDRNRARLRRPLEQNLFDTSGMAQYFRASRAHRLELRVQGGGELLFHFDIADLPEPVPRFQLVYLVPVRVEGVVVHEDRISLDIPRRVGANTVRIRVHPHHLLLDLVGAVG